VAKTVLLNVNSGKNYLLLENSADLIRVEIIQCFGNIGCPFY
jgi:hypothetical protein